MEKRTRRQVVVVTGASAGVGRAAVRAFARDGAWVGLVARGLDGLEGARREVEDAGGRALVLPIDVADAEAVEQAARRVEADLGPIDVWVNCAMTSVFSPVTEMRAEEYRRVTEVNYLGYVHGTLAVLERMRARDCGTIVQVSSALAFRSIPLQSAYCASKAAIVRFTESLRTELLHEGSRVRLTMVHLPGLNTPQFGWARSRLPRKAQPVPPIYQPEVAAEGIVWAARQAPRDLYVGGSTLATVLANAMAPGLLDRYLARTGYRSQQTDEPADPNRPDNLWTPVPGDHGAHGRFDSRAQASSLQLWAATHRGWLLAGLGVLAALAVAPAARRAMTGSMLAYERLDEADRQAEGRA